MMLVKNLYKILIPTILIILPAVFQVSADQTTIYATRYILRIYNSTQDAGQQLSPSSTTAQPVGMWLRYASWSAEILCVFDISSIPSSATINSVDFGYNVSDLGDGTNLVEINVCNRAWSGTPQYNDLGDAGDGAWDVEIANQTCSSTGWNGWDDNAKLKPYMVL